MNKKLIKIRKTFDNNIKVLNEPNEFDRIVESNLSKVTTGKQILKEDNSAVNSNKNEVKKSKTSEVIDKENCFKEEEEDMQVSESLQGLDDMFDDEWVHDKKETCNEMDELFKNDWFDDMDVDLNEPKRCIIIDIIWDKVEFTLTIKDPDNGNTAIVKCIGIW